MNFSKKSVLGLIVAVALSANAAHTGEGAPARGDGSRARGEGAPIHQLQNLGTSEAALSAWSNIGPAQPEVIIEGAPLIEVAKSLAATFKNQFDLILPPDDTPSAASRLQMRLKDVRAVEIFNAMNLYFQANKIQAQWTLMLNGTRPTAVLAVLHPAKPPGDAAPTAETERKHSVFSIADILYVPGYPNIPVNSQWITDAISMVLRDTQEPGHAAVNAPGGPNIQIHQGAGLLVFTGTAEETELVRSTLEALKQNALTDAKRKAETEQRAKYEAALKAAEDLKNKAPENLKK
ncbi:MAG TPA: hypothetical protein VN765_13260 [Candidatus Acidoferrum sp.]|nr:hypothetical protein [Candidatus Acidoferrum sp.]